MVDYEIAAVARLPPLRAELGREDLMLLRRCEALRLGDVLVCGTLQIMFSQNSNLRRGYEIRLNGRHVATVVTGKERRDFQERVLAARLAGWCKARKITLEGAKFLEGWASEISLVVRRPVVPEMICRYEYERPIDG